MEGEAITMALRNPLENYGLLLAAAKDSSTSQESLLQMTIVLMATRSARSIVRDEVSVHFDVIMIDNVLSEIVARADVPSFACERIATISDSSSLMGALSRNTAVPEEIRRFSKRILGHIKLLRYEREERARNYDAWRTVFDVAPRHVRKLLSLG